MAQEMLSSETEIPTVKKWLIDLLVMVIRAAAGWGMVICPIMYLLAISGSFATDRKFIVATMIGFGVSTAVWLSLRFGPAGR
jgi:hypothetical protein